jgi:2-polyprenyl-3-methyl-5-hydroxy-6-metoxy-1,4-benzoquinol methylase
MSASYPGTELELFATARHWKSYVAASLAPYVRGRVLDVGAGIGGNIRYLCNPAVTRWIALEPDPKLADKLLDSAECLVVNGTIAAIPDTARFDTILYMDVLEHIADDRREVEQAARLLAPGGCIVILAPAHQFLFSPFDAAIGHHRRYGLKALRALAPENVRTEMCRLMDSVGFFASLANRLLLRQSDPTHRQIAIWDRLMVRASRVLDPLAFFRIGKSALLVWRSSASGN